MIKYIEDVTPEYNPTMESLIDSTDDDWGNIETNRENLVPYGIPPIDKALYGMDVVNGETILWQGAEKNRKTTGVVNVIINLMLAKRPVVKPGVAIDTLESGMNPRRYRDTMIGNLATRYLLSNGHRYKEFCPVCNDASCRQMGITPEFLRFRPRSSAQKDAIEYARDTMRSWPIAIYGANPKEGNTRSLRAAVQGEKSIKARWARLIDEAGVKIFVVDHIQQYMFERELSDYEKQIRTVAAMSDVVAQKSIVAFILSQVSLTSRRDAAVGVGDLTAAGGAKAAAEASTIFTVSYASGSSKMAIHLQNSRRTGSFTVWQPLEDESGAFYGEAYIGNRPQVVVEGAQRGR